MPGIKRSLRSIVPVMLLILCIRGTGYALSEKTKSTVFFAPSNPALEMTKELTLEAWIFVNKNSRGGSIIDKTGLVSGSPPVRQGFALEIASPATLQFRTSKKENCTLNLRPYYGRWICITAIYSAEKRLFQLFLNGEEKVHISEGEFPGLLPNFSPLVIGTGWQGKFDGKISRIAIFARALTPQEVASRYANPLPCEDEIAEWKIMDGSGKKTAEILVGNNPLEELPPILQFKGLAPKPTEPLTMWYRKPATYWGEALPLGNGRIGAMIFGRINRERISLNEDSFWSGSPHDYANPAALQPLQQARSLVFKHQYAKADELLAQVMQGNPSTQCSLQPLGNLIVESPSIQEVANYSRQLNLTQGVVSVSYFQADNFYTREAFVSAADQVGVIRWSARSPASVSFSLWFDSPQQTTTEVENNEMLVIHGKVPASPRSHIPNKLQFVTRIKVMPIGGEMKAQGNKIEVHHANSITILWDAATNYRNYHDITADPDAITHDRISRASGKSFEQLLAAHLSEHKRLFNRVSLRLEDSQETCNNPTDERLKALRTGKNDPGLMALYFQFGRYTLLSTSRPGCQPATISGLWNENPFPESDSKYLLYGPTLLAYSPVEAANLSECLEPIAQLCRQLSETGARTAALMYGAGGWTCFAGTDLWRGSAPTNGVAFYTPVCGAALTSLLWKHYLYTGDQHSLIASYPFLKSASQFFLDSLQHRSNRQERITCPTVSPGSPHPPGAFSASSSTFDNSVLRELFKITADAAQTLNTDSDFREQLLETRKHLPPLHVDTSGQLQTWSKTWTPLNGTSLQSLYGLFPSEEISPRKTPQLAVAARKSLENTGESGPPWAEAWRACLWARLKNGNRTEKSLRQLLQPSRTSPNFFGVSPDFHLSGVWGATSAITEMLLQSHSHGEIELLPALPDAWSQGSIQGIRAYHGFEIDLAWKHGQLTHAVIRSSLGRECKIRYKNKLISFPTEKRRQYRLNDKLLMKKD